MNHTHDDDSVFINVIDDPILTEQLVTVLDTNIFEFRDDLEGKR